VNRLVHQKSFGVGTRIRKAVREYWSLLLGAFTLELVFIFSFRPGDGLYLIIPTLVIGTSVFIFDGRISRYKADIHTLVNNISKSVRFLGD
jgi:hypothetical protein